MKKLLFILLFALIFLPARAEDVTPTAENFVLFQPLTYTVKIQQIDNWWIGGYSRVAAMGIIQCALNDSTSVLDLYEFGFPSGIFLRRQKSNLSFPGEYGKILQLWISPQDFISAVIYPQIDFSVTEGHNDGAYFDIEYARRLSDSISIGACLMAQYQYTENGAQQSDFLRKYGRRRLNWLISIDWESPGFMTMGHEVGVRNALSVGTLLREFPQYWYSSDKYTDSIFSFESSDHYTYEKISPSAEASIYEASQANSGAGIAYAFMLSDPGRKNLIVFRLNTIYDWQISSRAYTYSGLILTDSDSYTGQAAVVNGCLAARLMLGDFLSFACIKNIEFMVSWGKDENDTQTQVYMNGNQPLVLEIAYINEFIKIPVSYTDFIDSPLIKIGLEWTVTKWLDLRAGCGFNGPGKFLLGALGFGAGINLETFILNGSFYNGGYAFELKWFF